MGAITEPAEVSPSGARLAEELPEGAVLLRRYAILDRFAGGGMATIYRATDERLDRVVCVKLLRTLVEGSGTTSGREVYEATYSHFLQEAVALSKLQHPNTLRIYDFGYLEDAVSGEEVRSGPSPSEGVRPFQISEFLDGGNLEQLVRARGPLPPAEVLAIIERMSGAVSEAHQHGIIHRDIKPSNILFTSVGGQLFPKLADFGIARCDLRKASGPRGPDDTVEIKSTVPLFSPRWAAPEQLAERDEGPATDVYALGLVATFMLGGRAPFDAADVRSTFTERVRGDDLVAGRLAALGVEGPVHAVLLDAMRADARARLAAPSVFHDRLSRALGLARAGLALPAAAPGGRGSHESITIEVSRERLHARAVDAPLPEHCLEVGGRTVRIVVVDDALDLSLTTGGGLAVRVRATLLPAGGAAFRLHVKGLNCFVCRAGSAPSPAVVAAADGAGELVSMARARLATVRWSFGRLEARGRVFAMHAGDVVVPPPAGALAVALELGDAREIVVICRRR